MMSDFLFARPSFSEGWGRIFDWGGALNQYNTSTTGEEADRRALMADWQILMDEFQQSFQTYLAHLSQEELSALLKSLDEREVNEGVTEEARLVRTLLAAPPPPH